MSNTLHLKAASQRRNNFDMSHFCLNTMNIGIPHLQMVQPVLPTDSIKLSCSAFMRLAPLAFPAYVRMSHKIKGVYVANYMVDEYYDYVSTGTSAVSGKTIFPLTLDYSDILTLFTAQTGSNVLTTPCESTDARRVFSDKTSGTLKYYKLTPKGSIVYKALKMLGYDLLSVNSISSMPDKVRYQSAYPLLCYVLYLNHYVYPQQFYTSRQMTRMLDSVRFRNDYVSQTNTYSRVTNNLINACFDFIANGTVMYNSDYFTTAWLNPNSVISGTSGAYKSQMVYIDAALNDDDEMFRSQRSAIRDINATFTYSNANQDGTPLITAQSINALQRFDAWVRRNNFVGSSTVNRLYSAFGIKVEQARSHIPDMVYSSSVPVNISDVTSFSDTKTSSSGSQLGSYVGKGYSSGNVSFRFKSPDFGYVFVVSYIVADPVYSRGVSRDVLVTDYQDIYQPEFDGLQASPVSRAELYSGLSIGSALTDDYQTYGFQPHYEWMRSHKDVVCGDFVTNSNYRSWFMSKEIPLVGGLVAQNDSFIRYMLNAGNHLFQDMGNDIDHFICSFDFNIKMNRPIKSSSQATGLEQGSLDIEKFGN